VIVALLAVAYVVVRDADRSDARFTIVSGPPDPVAAFELPLAPVHFAVRPTSVKGRGRVLNQVGTFLQPAKNTVIVTVLGPASERIARCASPPSSYHDNTQLACPVPDISRVRAERVERRGTARIAIISHEHTAGYLAADEQTSFFGRVSTVLSRIATPLPNGVGSSVALIALFGSIVLTVLVLLAATVGFASTESDTPGDGAGRGPGGEAG
jgi:hypothetical protein